MKGLLIKALNFPGKNTRSYMSTNAHIYISYFQYFLSTTKTEQEYLWVSKDPFLWATLPSLSILEMEFHFELQHIWVITRERGTTAISRITDYTCNDCQKCACGQKVIHISTKYTQPLATFPLLVLKSISIHQNHLARFFLNYRFRGTTPRISHSVYLT